MLAHITLTDKGDCAGKRSLMDDLVTKITNAGLQTVGYADHLMIVARGPFLWSNDRWDAGSSGWIMQSDRPALVCTSNQKWNHKCLLKIVGQELAYKNSMEYLIVILGRSMLCRVQMRWDDDSYMANQAYHKEKLWSETGDYSMDQRSYLQIKDQCMLRWFGGIEVIFPELIKG